MEIESVGELGNTLEFDFLFDEADLLLTNQQVTEMPSNQQIETSPENISTVEYGELGSSSESNNQPAATATINNDDEDESSKEKINMISRDVSTFTSSDLPDLPPLLNMGSPTCNNTHDIITINSPLIDILQPQIDPPADLITEINGEFGASADDHDHKREDAQVNNNNPQAQDQAQAQAQEINATVVELPQLPSSLNPPLMGIPAPQPYPPTLEYADQLISSTGGSNWSSSSNQNQMLMQSFPSLQSSNPCSTMNMNAWETTPSSLFTNPYPWPSHPFSPPPMAQDGVVVQPFHPERNQAPANQLINNYSFQQTNMNNNAPPNYPLENVPQFLNMPLSSQSMTPLNQLGTNNQMVQNVSNNNFMANNINQQSSGLYPNSFPQNNIMAVPVGPLANQQQQQQSIFTAPQLMNNNNPSAASAYRPSTVPSGCYWNQPNQVMAATNLMDPSQSTNFITPQATSFRPQQVPNQQPQQLNQVPQVPNMYDPKSQFSNQPGFSMPPIRPQNIPYQYQVNQAPQAPNVYDPLSSNSLLPELSSHAWTTPPQLSYTYNQQLNEIRPTNDNMLPGSSMPSRIQQLNNDAQLNQTQIMPNMVVPQLSNQLLPEQPLMKSAGVEQFNQVPLSTPSVYNNPNNFTMNGPAAVLSRPSDPVQPVQNQTMIPNVTESQICCSMMPTPSIHSKTQQAASDKDQQASGVPKMGADHPQRDNFELLESSNSVQSRLTDEELQELMNAANKAKPITAVPSYQNYILNSLTERERKDKNTGVTVPTRSKPSSTSHKEHGTSGRPRGRTAKRREGDSSVPSKRSRREAANRQVKTSQATKTAQEIVINADNSIITNPSLIRRIKNAVYDPMFEGMGLPIDPHLRMFIASNNKA